MKRKLLKDKIFEILKTNDLNDIYEELILLPNKKVINLLFSFLYSSDEEMKWKTIKMIGLIVARISSNDIEYGRKIMRRLIWSLNDESGSIGWNSPQVMGEIMANSEILAKEYFCILNSYLQKDGNFLDHDTLRLGVSWAINRVKQVFPDLHFETT